MPFPARSHTLNVFTLTLVLSLAWLPGQEEGVEVPEVPEVPSTGDLIAQGRHEEAAAQLADLLAQWETEVAANPSPGAHLNLARTLIWVGTVNDHLARLDAAIGHFNRSAALLEEHDGPPDVLGSAYDGLARALHRAGRYEEADQAFAQAIEARQKVTAEDRDRWVTTSRTHRALLYLTMGRYQDAGRLLQNVLAATPDDDVAQQALRRSYLGRYYHTIRSYAKARESYEKALRFAEKEWGRDHLNTVSILDQLGLTLLRQGEPALARAAMEEATALATKRATTRDANMRLATILNNFGNLLIHEGDLEGARERFRAALTPMRRHLGDDHPSLAPIWNNLAYTYQATGDHAEAVRYFTKVRDNYLRHVGPDHQRTVEALTNLALTSFLAGDEAARPQIAAAAEAHQRVFLRLVSFGSERQRLNYLQRVDPLSLPCTSGHDPGLIADTLLRTKGRLLDVLLAAGDESPDDLEAEWRLAQQRLDQLLASGAHPDGADSSRLRGVIARLEAEIETARRAADDSGEPTWKDVQERLLPRSAFVDFVRYTRYAPGREDTLAYGAIVILPTGEPRWIRLGTEETLQDWLGVMRDRLDFRAGQITGAGTRAAPALKLKPALQKLYDEFWGPVAGALPEDTATVCVCPDGTLNFLSFAVLMDEDDAFLADRYDIGLYVSSGRDLLTDEPAGRLSSKPWTIFSVSKFAQVPAATFPPATHYHAQLSGFLSRLSPIAGADREVRVLRPFLPKGSQVFTRTEATEEQLAALEESPAVLHLVTHGFFLPGDPDPLPRLADFDESPDRLSRSGIVLHGAKGGIAPERTASDDILFASDVAGLPLGGTRLVTLSSCESALGETLAGEGVLGLRRGFAMAGAQNLLLTLWPVSDASTPDFMKRFYQIATETNHLGQAAWQAQRESLARIDPGNEVSFEEAILRAGPFVLCQREALVAPSANIPPAPDPKSQRLWLILGGAALLLWIVVLMFAKAVRR